jgi:NAD(P)-dependent dehydrogenase (short-subunit alcohol dehydrogenase family)
MTMDLELDGKIAIVTGGSLGIGKGIVECLAREGTTVVIGARHVEPAHKLAKQVGNGSIGIQMDVTKKADICKSVKTTLDRFGKIDILVNNAGMCRYMRFVDIEDGVWDMIHDLNLKGLFRMTQAVLPHMIERRYGKIINVASLLGKSTLPGYSGYSASKFGVIGLTQALAKEYAEYNININAVCPGIVRTPLWDELLATISKEQGISPGKIWEDIINFIPLKRPQTLEDNGNMVAYLASDISKNMTGQAINITGGQQMD